MSNATTFRAVLAAFTLMGATSALALANYTPKMQSELRTAASSKTPQQVAFCAGLLVASSTVNINLQLVIETIRRNEQTATSRDQALGEEYTLNSLEALKATKKLTGTESVVLTAKDGSKYTCDEPDAINGAP